MHRDALTLTPLGHPDKPDGLNNLASCLRTRFECIGELKDLEEAVSSHKDALELIPDGRPTKPDFLNNLANSLVTRFHRLGEVSDLEQAILRHRDAVKLTPDGHPGKPGFRNNLANSFLTRFERLGELTDLAEAISQHRNALQLISDGHPAKLGHLNNLALCCLARFQHLGELSNLEEAISKYRYTLELTLDGNPEKANYLDNLAVCLLARFQRLGELRDLDQAISGHRDALGLTPDGHRDKPGRLNNLALCLHARFERLNQLTDLEQAISMHRDAVHLTPDERPDKHVRMNNLAVCFLARFESLSELSDLEEAISRHQSAIQLVPDGHPDKPSCLNNIALCFLARFRRLGELCDLEQAISSHTGAVELIPDGHHNKPTSLNNLALCFLTRFQRFGEPSDLEQAILRYSLAARASTGPTTTRFHASLQWISCARSLGHHSLLQAYSVAIDLLPQLAWIGLSLTHRYRELVQGTDVVREAAAAALESGRPETAVEWLEQGRSIVWGELFQLRSSYEELASAHPDLAHQLQQLSSALEHASVTRDKSSSLEQSRIGKYHFTKSLEREAESHRALAIKRDQLLQEIRALSGFERFLRHKEFSQLRASAHSGPVVILNAAESRCDALIVHADVEGVIHVPLPGFTLKRSGVLQNALNGLLGHARDGVIPRDDRDGQRASRRDVSWESVLSSLWRGVVRPVLDALDFSVRVVLLLGFRYIHVCRTDTRGLITHFLVRDWTLHVSSYPCSWSLWFPVLGT